MHTQHMLGFCTLAQAVGLSIAAVVARSPASREVSLSVPSRPPAGRQVVDANYQSYSIEFSYMQDFAGNNTHPNLFSRQLMANLGDISGALPIIRAGGSTANRAVFTPNQTEGVILTYNEGTWEDQPDVLTIGPSWIESFQQFPAGTPYIYNLNFYWPSVPVNGVNMSGIDQTVLEAANAWQGIGENLYGFEIGNEVNGWNGTSRRPADWNLQDYVDQWKQYAQAIEDGALHSSAKEPLFQGCAFTAPSHLENGSDVWNVANAVRDGMGSTGKLKDVADHEYMGANCHTTKIPTLAGNLLDHHHMTGIMWKHELLGNQTAELGVPYVIGETNSISCQGTVNISDVFGAAIWSVDYILYGAGLKVSRMHLHMGTPYRYSAWQPITINGTAPNARPLYYGNMFTSTALAGGDKQVVSVLNETSLTAYAIYSAKHSPATLESLAVVNLEQYNMTQSASARPYTAFKFPAHLGGWSRAKVRRLTAPGTDARTNVTFAGQYVDDTGCIVGELDIERVHNGQVLVAAGEAVLVSL